MTVLFSCRAIAIWERTACSHHPRPNSIWWAFLRLVHIGHPKLSPFLSPVGYSFRARLRLHFFL